MLRVSKLADYGTIIMVYLASTQFPCSAREIARNTHLSLPTVSKLLKRLTKVGLLFSVRGANGGYELGKSAQDISLAEVIYAIDVPKGLTECSHSECFLQKVCKIDTKVCFLEIG